MVGADEMMPVAARAYPAIPPAGMAIAAITVMLWLIWSDTVRQRRGSGILYAVRVALFLIVGGILVLNRVRYPDQFSGPATLLVAIAVGVALAGAVYFGRRLVRRV